MLICETKMLTFNVKVVKICQKNYNFSKLVKYQSFGKICIIFFLQSQLTDHFNRLTHLKNLPGTRLG